ncbi:MAG: DsbA family protein, partial [Sphingomonadaceae bacterium]|nr:DsbA family protein [Sphingomonadaceae bacterium]
AQAARDGAAADVSAELANNLELARELRISGTPAFIVGDQLLSGAVGYERLKQAIAEARAAG